MYHAGTKLENGKLLTNGGRVLGVTATAKTLDEALEKAYAAVEKIHFDGAHYRHDLSLIHIFVSGGGTNLQALIDAEKAGKIENGKISVVVASKPGVYALERAKNAGIEGIVLARSDYENVDAYSEALENLLKEKHTDLIVLAGFMTITNEKFTKAFENKIINVHPALIPSFCGKGYYGLHVHEAALARGVKVSGATVHFVNEVCDGGPIILQKAVPVEQGDTPETLQRRIMEQAEWLSLIHI